MIKIDRYYAASKKSADKENLKKLKQIRDDTKAQAIFVFEKYLEALDTMMDFVAVCKVPDVKKTAILEKTETLKADIKELAANL
jgi:hypothetical protein